MTSLVYTPAGDWLASGHASGEIRLHETISYTVSAQFSGLPQAVVSLAVDPDGSRLAGAGEDGSLRIWEIPGGALAAELNGHTRRVTDLVFSPDGSLLASSGIDQLVIVWSVESNAPAAKIRLNAPVSSLAFGSSPASGYHLLILGGADGVVQFWSVPGG